MRNAENQQSVGNLSMEPLRLIQRQELDLWP
jgi:hypothetical protein